MGGVVREPTEDDAGGKSSFSVLGGAQMSEESFGACSVIIRAEQILKTRHCADKSPVVLSAIKKAAEKFRSVPQILQRDPHLVPLRIRLRSKTFASPQGAMVQALQRLGRKQPGSLGQKRQIIARQTGAPTSSRQEGLQFERE